MENVTADRDPWHSALLTGSAWNYVSVPFDFCVCSHSYHLHLGSVVLYFWRHAVSHGYSSATTQWPLPAMQM